MILLDLVGIVIVPMDFYRRNYSSVTLIRGERM